MSVTGQSDKELAFYNRIREKNLNRKKLAREYRESEMKLEE